MDMYRLLKISSITGSTLVPMAWRSGRASMRSSTMWSRGVTSACQPGSTTVVALASAMMAGPLILSPGCSDSRRNTGVACCFPLVNICTVSAASGAPLRVPAAGLASTGASDAPMASTDTASAIRPRLGMRKE